MRRDGIEQTLHEAAMAEHYRAALRRIMNTPGDAKRLQGIAADALGFVSFGSGDPATLHGEHPPPRAA